MRRDCAFCIFSKTPESPFKGGSLHWQTMNASLNWLNHPPDRHEWASSVPKPPRSYECIVSCPRPPIFLKRSVEAQR